METRTPESKPFVHEVIPNKLWYFKYIFSVQVISTCKGHYNSSLALWLHIWRSKNHPRMVVYMHMHMHMYVNTINYMYPEISACASWNQCMLWVYNHPGMILHSIWHMHMHTCMSDHTKIVANTRGQEQSATSYELHQSMLFERKRESITHWITCTYTWHQNLITQSTIGSIPVT